jgi:DNA mismatch endonuclease (patch repair protein)
MDVHTKSQRSYNMSRVRSKNTKPELLMFSLLEEAGIKFEKHYPISGKPDIAFPEHKVAVFIDGEFWHGKDYVQVKDTLPSFWVKKIGDNIKRDRKNKRLLRNEGWHILHLWDKRVIRNPSKSFQRVKRFLERVKNLG